MTPGQVQGPMGQDLAGRLVELVTALRSKGVPSSSLVVGGVLGVVGFFVVPVIGLPLGFVLGIYLAELQRVGRAQAWPATRHASRRTSPRYAGCPPDGRRTRSAGG